MKRHNLKRPRNAEDSEEPGHHDGDRDEAQGDPAVANAIRGLISKPHIGQTIRVVAIVGDLYQVVGLRDAIARSCEWTFGLRGRDI